MFSQPLRFSCKSHQRPNKILQLTQTKTGVYPKLERPHFQHVAMRPKEHTGLWIDFPLKHNTAFVSTGSTPIRAVQPTSGP